MNPLNYASLEASKRLVEAGIVLETDFVWFRSKHQEWIIIRTDIAAAFMDTVGAESIPALSMSEVWRELPIGSLITKCRNGEITHLSGFGEYSIANVNPTDALIDLLVRIMKSSAQGDRAAEQAFKEGENAEI